jgi:hypothetical protein
MADSVYKKFSPVLPSSNIFSLKTSLPKITRRYLNMRFSTLITGVTAIAASVLASPIKAAELQ